MEAFAAGHPPVAIAGVLLDFYDKCRECRDQDQPRQPSHGDIDMGTGIKGEELRSWR